MSKAENTSENEEKIENQNEQNNSINIEENDSVKSENLSSIQEETENSQNEENVQSENLEEGKNQNTQNYNFANLQKTLISKTAEKVKQNQESKEKNVLENPQKSEVQEDNSENSGKSQKRKLEKEYEDFVKPFQVEPEIKDCEIDYKYYLNNFENYVNSFWFPDYRIQAQVVSNQKAVKECFQNIYSEFYSRKYPNSVVLKQNSDSKTESMIIDGFESVVILTPDGKEKIYKCPESENKNRKWFISYHMGVPIYTEGKSVIDSILKNAGLTYNAGKIFGENKGKLLDRFGNSIKNIYRPAPVSNLLRDLLINAAKNDVYVSDKTLYSKWGEHITGKNGNLVELDNGKGKVISNVPYFSQLLAQTKDEYIDENGEYKTITGKVLCQLTAIAMLLWVKGIKGSTDKYFPDELYDDAEELNFSKNKIWDNTDSLYKEILNKFDNSLLLKIIESESEGKEEYKKIIQNQIDKGIPVPTSIHYKIYDKGKEIDANHVIFIVGYTEKGFIVIDPYGNLNKGKNSHLSDDFDGSYVEYAYDKYDICNRHIYLINKNKGDKK